VRRTADAHQIQCRRDDGLPPVPADPDLLASEHEPEDQYRDHLAPSPSSRDLTFRNYAVILTDPSWYMGYVNSMIYVVMNTVISI
jgi:ABC-type glycerol-3-phosphate transport system permease component